MKIKKKYSSKESSPLTIKLTPKDPPPPPGADRPPRLLPGGDLRGLSIPEGTEPGSEVYRLRAEDPEGRPVSYTVSGDWLSVDEKTGVVR